MKYFEEYAAQEGFPVTSTQEPLFRKCWDAAQDAIYSEGPYSSGILEDGAVILDNGARMRVEEIVVALNGYHQRVASLLKCHAQLQDQVQRSKQFNAGLFAGFAARVERAEPYLRNGTITRYITDLAADLRKESTRLLGER